MELNVRNFTPNDVLRYLKSRTRTGPGVKLPRIVFDIETAPGPEEYLRSKFVLSTAKLPRNLREDLPPFDPANVKLGNLKDQQKIQAKILTARLQYPKQMEAHKAEREAAIEKQYRDFVTKAPLEPSFGQVVAIGYGFEIIPKKRLGMYLRIVGEPSGSDAVPLTEAIIIQEFWDIVKHLRHRTEPAAFYGHNIERFDVPFLTKRARILELSCPYVFSDYGRLIPSMRDTLRIWSCGTMRSEEKIHGHKLNSLDHIGKTLGLGGKFEDRSGAHFHVWLKENPDLAKQYLARDIELTYVVANRLGMF